jgi:hypothetical protein
MCTDNEQQRYRVNVAYSNGSVGAVIRLLTARPTPIRRLNQSVPKILADATERCLQKDPEHRFGSVMELWGQLQRVSFFPPPEPPPPISLAARNSYLAGWLAVLALGLAVFGTAALRGLPSWSFGVLAGLFASLAALTSPSLRGAIQSRGGLREVLRQWRPGSTPSAIGAPATSGPEIPEGPVQNDSTQDRGSPGPAPDPPHGPT